MKKVILAIALVLTLAQVCSAEIRFVNGSVTLNATNESVSLVLPSQNFTSSVPVNQDFLFNLAYGFPPYSNLSQMLGSQQTVQYGGCFENLTVSCSAGSCSNTTTVVQQSVVQGGWCNYSNRIDPGQSLNLQSNECSLNISATTNFAINGSYNVSKILYLGKNGADFSLQMDNFSKAISGGWDNATLQIPITYECPVAPAEQLQQVDAQAAFNMCSYFFPSLNSWLNLTLNRCFDNYDAYRDYVNTRDKVITDASQALSDCRAVGGTKDGQINSLTSQVLAQQEQLKNDESTKQIELVVIAILILIILVLLGVLGFAIHRIGGDVEGSHGGGD